MKDGTKKFDTAGAAIPHGPYMLAAALVLAASLGSTVIAVAQNAQPQSPSGAGVAAPTTTPSRTQAAAPARGLFPTQPPPAETGFIYAFGRWWDRTRGKLDDLNKQSSGPGDGAAAPPDVLKNAAEATKNAATAIVRLPGARFVEVHQRCATAPNGAPDCRTAAASACRTKGFTDGHPIDVQSSENCPPAVWMSGREPNPGECPEETVVLMAACD